MGILRGETLVAEDQSLLVPISDLVKDPYREVLAFPKPADSAVQSRVHQLRKLGVSGLEFKGPLKIGRVSVLGKGVVGIVVAGEGGGKKVAVKIRRVDSRRLNMIHEASMMSEANKAGIGPHCLGYTQDILMMEFLKGQRLPVWLSSLKGRGRKSRVRSTFRNLLEQSVKLDAYGLDHGELSRAHKNVLITDENRPWILDFESASMMRRVNNFTSIAQYLFLGGGFAKKVSQVLGTVEKSELVDCLRLYKSGMTNDAFEAALKLLKL